MKFDIRLKSHFLIIHKYSSLSVHECHVNEHTGGRGEAREGEGEGTERGKRTATIGGKWGEKERGNGRRREGESDESGGEGGGIREEQRWVSVTSR